MSFPRHCLRKILATKVFLFCTTLLKLYSDSQSLPFLTFWPNSVSEINKIFAGKQPCLSLSSLFPPFHGDHDQIFIGSPRRSAIPLLASVSQTMTLCLGKFSKLSLSLHLVLAKVLGQKHIYSIDSTLHILPYRKSWLLCSCLLQQISDTLEKYFWFLFTNYNYFQQEFWAATNDSILIRNRSLVYVFSWDVHFQQFEKTILIKTLVSWDELCNNSQMYKIENWLYKE